MSSPSTWPVADRADPLPDPVRPIRVLSLYQGFFSGGARILHTDLLVELHRRRQDHAVLSLQSEVFRENSLQRIEDDACYQKLLTAGVPVTSLQRGRNDTGADVALSRADWAMAVDEVSKADLILSLKEQPLHLLENPGMPRRPTVACLHRSDPENQADGLGHLKRAITTGRVLAAICCAESTKNAYAAAGIPRDLLHVIPNGVNLQRFRSSDHLRGRLRHDLGIPLTAPVILFAARYDRMKNVPLFLKAATLFLHLYRDAHVIMCGAGMTGANAELVQQLPSAPHRIHLLGVCNHMELIYPASDVVALTSAFGEAAPLCLIEGMVCGAVPVTTDVGDAALIVGEHGFLTPPDPYEVASTWARAVSCRSELLPELLRNRKRFDQEKMVTAYAAFLNEVHDASLARTEST